MFTLSFRAKLLLAMMLVVAGVTGATLFVTQQKVRATYQRLFQELFESQVNYFTQRQEERLVLVKERCEALAASVRFRAAVEDEDPSLIYDNAWDELNLPGLRSLRTIRNALPERAASVQPNRGLRDVFLRVLDVQGRVIHPPDPRGRVIPLPARARLERQLVFVGRSVPTLKAQQVGYLTPPDENDAAPLREVIVTPIHDVEGKLLGAVVLGLTVPDLGERTLHEMSKIQSGLWLDGEVHSKTIPEASRPALAQLLTRLTAEPASSQETVAIPIEGVPHRIFCRLLNPDSPFPPAYQVCLYSLAQALQTQRELRWRVLGLSVLALLGGFGASLFLSHRLSVALREMAAGTEQIRRGNLQVKVPVRSRDDVGTLASSINEMAEGLALKERYHNVLNMVADKEVADQLIQGQVALGGELRTVSMLFCDIRGFTSLTQGMPPAEVIHLLNEHMTSLTRVVYEHQGVVDKFVGDLIMAIFGAPKSYGRDALQAVRCGWRMIEERDKLNRHSAHQIHVGIGIATGRVVAGCMGSTDRLNYTVLGDRVNLGSRLCGQAGPGQVVIDQETRDLLREALQVEPLPPLALKGFSEKVQAYRVVGLAPGASS